MRAAAAKKDVTLQIRVTPAMKAAIEAWAARDGLSVSNYLRRMVARKIRLDATGNRVIQSRT